MPLKYENYYKYDNYENIIIAGLNFFHHSKVLLDKISDKLQPSPCCRLIIFNSAACWIHFILLARWTSTNENLPDAFKTQATPKKHLKGQIYITRINVRILKGTVIQINKYMIRLTQITNTEIVAFIAVLVFKLLSRQALVINRKDNRNR